MEETKKEVVEETTQKEQPVVDNKVEKIKVKKPRAKKFKNNDEPIKVDLTKPVENKTEEPAKIDLTEEKQKVESVEEVKEEKPKEEVKEETPVVEEITNEEVKKVEEAVEEAVEQAVETGKPLPENVQKLVDFMEETGGDLNDYVALNRDISKLDDQDALLEYYRKTKPHLTLEEINFLMDDQFSYDEESMDQVEIKRKKLALKEQVADARKHLDGLKSKYYEEVKARDKRLTPDQQKAVDFFNRYNKEQEVIGNNHKVFVNKTNQVFNKDFKGFEYNVGDKRFRLNINDVAQVKETQSNADNFFKKFLNENNVIGDAQGYHKSIYTAMNPDAVARHFYEQGKADAMKERIAKDKNVQLNPRQAQGEINTGGLKFKVLGDNSDSLKVKMRKRK
tara:strand:+ start:1153 stop:2331 length:1179 start_codon:yes stop_codon:yes gene_type:complete